MDFDLARTDLNYAVFVLVSFIVLGVGTRALAWYVTKSDGFAWASDMLVKGIRRLARVGSATKAVTAAQLGDLVGDHDLVDHWIETKTLKAFRGKRLPVGSRSSRWMFPVEGGPWLVKRRHAKKLLNGLHRESDGLDFFDCFVSAEYRWIWGWLIKGVTCSLCVGQWVSFVAYWVWFDVPPWRSPADLFFTVAVNGVGIILVQNTDLTFRKGT